MTGSTDRFRLVGDAAREAVLGCEWDRERGPGGALTLWVCPRISRPLSGTNLLAYPPETAGGIMTTEFVGVPADWTAEQALQHVGRVGGAKETIYAIYVLDPTTQRLAHVVSLRELVTADRARRVAEVGARRTPVVVSPLTDREEVARLISKYDLLAVPVLDDVGRVLGIVTVDDVIDAIVAESTEDVQKFGGVEAFDEPYMRVRFLTMVRKRAGWLISTSLIIRAMALGEVGLRDWWRVARRDIPTGLTLGSLLGAIAVARILLWQALGLTDYGPHYALVAATVGASVVGVVAFGSFTGSMLPFLIRCIGLDPATASAPFVATLVDVTGIVIYFSIATLFLRGTLL